MNPKAFLPLLLLALPLFLSAQQEQPDSLIFTDIVQQGLDWSKRDSDSALHYMEKAVDYAKEKNNEVWEFLAHLATVEVYGLSRDFSAADSIMNELENREIFKKNDKVKAKFFMRKANLSAYQNDYQGAVSFFEKGLSFGPSPADSVSSLLNTGLCLNRLGEYDKALSRLEKAETMLHLIEKPNLKWLLFKNMGGIFSSIGDSNKAIEYYKKALAVPDITGANLASTYYSLAIVFGTSSGTLDSQYYYLSEVAKLKDVASKSTMVLTYGSLTNYFTKMEQLDSAQFYLSLYEETGSPLGFMEGSSYYQYKGLIEIKQKQWDKAVSSLETAYKNYIEVENDDPAYFLSIRSNLLKAKIGAAAGESLITEFDSVAAQVNLIHQKMVDEEVQKWRVRYETEEVENQAKLLEKDVALKEATVSRQRIALGLIGLVLLIAAMSAMLFFRQRNKIEKANQTLGLLYKELQHRTKNYLQTVGALFTLQSAGMKDEGARKAMEEGRQRVEAMKLLEQRLLREQHAASVVRVRAYLDELTQGIVHTMGSIPALRIEHDIQDIELDVEKAMSVGIIVNELITNSCKHGLPGVADPRVRVSLEKGEQKIRLVVEDNGKGLPGEFNLAQTESFGLKIVKLFADKLDAKLSLQNTPGARFEMEF